jgi:hypothetical protein
MKFLKGFFLMAVLLITQNVCSQDTIIKIDQTEINAKVQEITDTSVKYKYWNRKDGPTYNINKTDILLIIYQDGTKEYYSGKKTTNRPIKSDNNTAVKTTEGVARIDKNLLNKSEKNTTATKTTSTKTSATIDKSLLAQSESRNKPNTRVVTNTSNETPKEEEKKEEEEDSFTYREGAKVNYGFGYDKGAADSAITIGVYIPVAFSDDSRGSMELEVGATAIATSGSSFGNDFSTSLYTVSLAFGYGYYFIDDLKVYAGGGYYYGFGGTSIDGNRVGDASINGIYIHTGVEYWFTRGFGMNVRYDTLMGPSVGIHFKSF